MKSHCLFILTFAAVFACAYGAETLPPVIDRYEQLLIRSPGKGTAFDKVYQHFFEGEGLEKLAGRWKSKAEGSTPEAGIYTLLLGTLAERQGQEAEALRQYQRSTELRPQDARAWMALGEAQAGAGRLVEAVASLQKALAVNPSRELRPALFRQLARSQQRAFDAEGALKTWQQFVAESPDDPFVIEEAADAMADAERFAEAQAQYEKLRDLPVADPYKRVTAIMKLAQLEEKQGRQEKANALTKSRPMRNPASGRNRIEEQTAGSAARNGSCAPAVAAPRIASRSRKKRSLCRWKSPAPAPASSAGSTSARSGRRAARLKRRSEGL